MQKKTKTIIIIILGIVASLTSIFILFSVIVIYNFPDMSSQYGIVNILVEGKQLYFKREARGLNYDQLILSASKDHCADYITNSDYRFQTANPTVFYKTEAGILYLIAKNVVTPKDFPVKVSIIEPDVLPDWETKKSNLKEKGFELLEIPIVDDLKCN
jgi:amino acid transporter